jgi:hypothetical protein
MRSVYTNTRALAILQTLHTLHGEIVGACADARAYARLKEMTCKECKPP